MTRGQLTKRYVSSARVAAPRDQVWAEVGSLVQILQHSHGVTDFDSAADGRSAKVKGSVALGPVRLDLACNASVRSIDPKEHLEWVGEVSGLALELACKLQLEEVAADQTAVRYEVLGSAPRRNALRAGLWSLLSTEIETYADQFVDRVATLAEQHARARKQLGGDSTGNQ